MIAARGGDHLQDHRDGFGIELGALEDRPNFSEVIRIDGFEKSINPAGFSQPFKNQRSLEAVPVRFQNRLPPP